MKIVSWNCNMAFRHKITEIMQLKPDLLVLQECEHVDKIIPKLAPYKLRDYDWFGDNTHKGVAFLNFSDYPIVRKHGHELAYRYVVPYQWYAPKPIDLYVVWAMGNALERHKRYVGQIWQAINHYNIQISGRTIIIGDFNSNTIWDSKRKTGNHTDLVEFLEERAILSLYHEFRKENSGEESEPTYFMYKQEDRPYHIDYCFASRSLISKHTTIKIGEYEKWIKLSDHMPLTITQLDLI